MKKTLKDIRYKLTNLYFKKEKDYLIKKHKKRRFFEFFKMNLVNLFVGSMLGVTFFLAIMTFILICSVFNYDVNSWFDIFNSNSVFLSVFGIASLITYPLVRLDFINMFKMVKNNDIEGFNKQVFDLEDEVLIKEMGELVVDNETLSIMKKEMLNYITEKELSNLLKNSKFINLSKTGSVTYEYFYYMIKEIEKKYKDEEIKEEVENAIKFQENILLKKENVNQEIKENIVNRNIVNRIRA